MRRWSAIVLLALFVALLSFARPLCAQCIGVGYYNLGALYDTIPSPFYNDEPFTPQGSNSWNSERYTQQIDNIAKVIDSMSLSIVGLYGPENEAVVRDIVEACDQDYSFVHRTRLSLDGCDFALLYFGDQLSVESVASQRNMLIVEAQLLAREQRITIILTRQAGDTLDYFEQQRNSNSSSECTVVLGQLYASQLSELGLVNTLHKSERAGRGNALSYRGWWLHDRIGVSTNLKILNSGVYIAPWLLSPTTQGPLPTLDGGEYLGGYSKYLPIFVYLL